MRIGIDTGGTFTDVVVADGGRLSSFKVPSTPRDPSAAILEALASLPPGVAGRAVVHGSTVATNALLEGRAARAGLVTTAGFEDVLEIGRQARPSLYDLDVERPRPLVPRALRFGVPGRILAGGSEREPLDLEAVRRSGEAARAAGAVSIAVCFLHAYARPDHEEAAGRLLASIFPGAVTLSTALVREFREYERCSTAVVNAAVQPIVGAYLRRLGAALPGGRLRIMGSNGGAVGAERAASEAVRTVLSGPAAGVVAAHRLTGAAGIERRISFDMGGTSTDVSLIPGGILLTGETILAGHPIRTPVIDIHTVGAGGGSIAWIDAGGALKVGPRSAGAEPGPACYGRGGPATVTDANLVLGRIAPERFLDGRMPLDRAAAERAVAGIAARLGLPLPEAAAGILEVANVTMARALRQVSLFRGHDPADFVLVAFGGAGGLHAADVAESAGIADVLVPPAPGVLSAWGLLAGDVAVGRSRTVLVAASERSESGLEEAFGAMEADVRRALDAEAAGSLPGATGLLERAIEARYRGQSHEIPVPGGAGWTEAFHLEHRRRYGFDRRDEEVIAVTLRVAGRLAVEAPPPPSPWGAGSAAVARGARPMWDRGAWREGTVVERSGLRAGDELAGPAVVTEPGATSWIPVGARATVAPDGSLRVRRTP